MLVKDTAENLLHIGCGDEGINDNISYTVIIVFSLNIDRVFFNHTSIKLPHPIERGDITKKKLEIAGTRKFVMEIV